MAKRMLLHYQKGAFPAYELVDEQGMPQPCALGIPWVNPDTQRTLAQLRIPRTDPWGRPIERPETTSRGGSGEQDSAAQTQASVVARPAKPARQT